MVARLSGTLRLHLLYPVVLPVWLILQKGPCLLPIYWFMRCGPEMLSLALFGLLLSLVSIFRALARLSESPHMIEGKEKRLQLTRIFGHCPDDLITDLVNLVVTSLHLGASGEGADKLSE